MEILKKVRDLVKPQYSKLNCWMHSWPHIEYVVEKAEELAKLEGINPIPCIIAAYCHDLGRVEEEKRKERKEDSVPHALLSIEPTIKVLQEAGITGIEFGEIIEAVVVHSYRIYEGKNNVARILQDADKMSGMSLWGMTCVNKDAGGKDHVNPQEIVKNWRDKKKIREFEDYTLARIEREISPKVIGILNFLLEYVDKEMFHTESARRLVQKDYEYLVRCGDFLAKKYDLPNPAEVKK